MNETTTLDTYIENMTALYAESGNALGQLSTALEAIYAVETAEQLTPALVQALADAAALAVPALEAAGRLSDPIWQRTLRAWVAGG